MFGMCMCFFLIDEYSKSIIFLFEEGETSLILFDEYSTYCLIRWGQQFLTYLQKCH